MPDPIIPPQPNQQPTVGIAPGANPAPQQQDNQSSGSIPSPSNNPADLGVVNVLAKGNNIERADILKKKAEADKDFHPNEQMNPLRILFGLISGNLNEVHKGLNGGPKYLDEGTAGDGRTVFKERNSNGYTNRYFEKTSEDGWKELGIDDIKEIERNGGVITQHDMKNLNTGAFKGLAEIEQARRMGVSLPVIKAMNTAVDTARIASQSSNALDTLNKLTKDTNVLDVWKTLSPAARQRVLEYTSFQKGNTGSTSGSTTNSKGESATSQNTQSLHVDANGKILGAKVSGGGSISGSQSGTASQNNVNETGTTSGTSFSGAGNQESQILGMLQKEVTNPQDVSNLMNWIKWNRKVNEYDAMIPPELKAPGTRATIDPDLAFTDRLTTVKNNYDRIANNLTQAAYAEFLARKVRTNDIGKGEQALQEEFLKSNKYKAIRSTFDRRREGLGNVPDEEGNLRITNQNKVEIFEDGQWRPANAK